MLKVDARRMFTMPTVWIMLGVSLALPILILVMTSFMSGTTVDPQTGVEETVETFTNVWQAIGSAGGNAMSVFVSIALTLATVAKQRLWLSILGSLAAGMLLFTMIPMMTPLNSGAFNVALCVAGGPLFAAGLGAVSNVILSKTSLV